MSQKSESNQILWPLFKVHLKPLRFISKLNFCLKNKKIRVTLNQLLKALKPIFFCLLTCCKFQVLTVELLSSTGIFVYFSGHYI